MSDTVLTRKRARSGASKRTAAIATDVFSQLDVPDADVERKKVLLAAEINKALSSRGATQLERAMVLGVAQPIVSNLERFELGGFSLDRLFRYAAHLGLRFEVLRVDSTGGSAV